MATKYVQSRLVCVLVVTLCSWRKIESRIENWVARLESRRKWQDKQAPARLELRRRGMLHNVLCYLLTLTLAKVRHKNGRVMVYGSLRLSWKIRQIGSPPRHTRIFPRLQNGEIMYGHGYKYSYIGKCISTWFNIAFSHRHRKWK